MTVEHCEQEISQTVCNPVIRTRSSRGPRVTLTLQKKNETRKWLRERRSVSGGIGVIVKEAG